MSLEVIISTYRDGSLHPEMWLASFFDRREDDLVCHLIDDRFYTACGKSFFGKLSSTGLGDPNRVDCSECRQLLAHLPRFVLARDPKLAVAS